MEEAQTQFVAVAEATGSRADSGQSNLVQAIQQSTQESTNQAGQRIVEKDINIQAYHYNSARFPLRVIVHKDLVLAPYRADRSGG